MKTITKAELNEALEKVMEMGNPYINESVKYFRGLTTVYLFHGTTYTEEELNEAYRKTATKDITNGYNERMVGYYDKWYRYNHADEGRAYDFGQRLASNNPKCSEEFHIIPA